MNNEPVNNVVQATDITRIYHLGRSEVAALRGVNLCVRAGEFVAVRGRSGSGKTTLLNIIGGLDRPDSGTVLFDDRDVTRLSEQELNGLRRHQVGFVFQSFGLLPQFSAYENVDLILRLARVPRAQRRERATECLTMVGLGQRLHHRPYELSGGQQQRLCIARALAVDPEVLLLDEPCSALDPIATAKIEELLFGLEEQCTIVIVTHNMQQAARVADFTGFFLLGRLVEFNDTAIIFKTPAKKETEDYITGRFG